MLADAYHDEEAGSALVFFTFQRPRGRTFKESMMKGQEGKKTEKKEPAKTMKEKKAAKKIKKEEKSRQ